MGGNYPPGTSAGDPNAPWNAPDPPECPACENLIAEVEDHADDCEESELDAVDLAEAEQEPSRTWDDVKEDPTPSEAERYGLDRPDE
jgi:hypothetical protein